MSTSLSKHSYESALLVDFIDIDLPVYDTHLIKSFKKKFTNVLLQWNSYGMNRSILSPTWGQWIKNMKTNSTSLKGPESSRIEISLYDFSIYLQNIHLVTLCTVFHSASDHKRVIQDKQHLALCIHILLCQAIKFKYPKTAWLPSPFTSQTYSNFLDKLLTCLHICIAHRHRKNFIRDKTSVLLSHILEKFPLWMLYCDKILQLTKDLTNLKPICCNHNTSNITYNKPSMFVLKKESLLIAGYIRKSVQYIPDVIADLCKRYFTEIFLWHSDKYSLQNSGGFRIKESATIIDGIKFLPELYLNKNKSLSFYLKIESIPSNISSITVYYELYFKEMGIEYMNILAFQKTNDILHWNSNNSDIECMNIVQFQETDDILYWNYGSNVLIPLSSVQQYARLNFRFFVKILCIQYKKCNFKCSDKIIQPMSIKQCIKWNLDVENELLIIDNYTTGKYIFQPVERNDNWMLFIALNGKSGKCYLGIQLTTLCTGIDKIVCSVDIQLMGVVIWNDIYAFSVDKSRLEIDIGSIKAHKIKRIMQLNVTITILEVIGNLCKGSSFDTNALNRALYGL